MTQNFNVSKCQNSRMNLAKIITVVMCITVICSLREMAIAVEPATKNLFGTIFVGSAGLMVICIGVLVEDEERTGRAIKILGKILLLMSVVSIAFI